MPRFCLTEGCVGYPLEGAGGGAAGRLQFRAGAETMTAAAPHVRSEAIRATRSPGDGFQVGACIVRSKGLVPVQRHHLKCEGADMFLCVLVS